MMVPFDGTGGPQQGHHPQGGMAPQPMPMPPMGPPPGSGRSQSGPNGVGMPPGGMHPTMGGGPYGHRNSLGMQQGPPFMPPPSPARQGSFTGSMPGNPPPPQYPGHPPLHSPHQPLPPPPQQRGQSQQQPPPHMQHHQVQMPPMHHPHHPHQGPPPPPQAMANFRHHSMGSQPPPGGGPPMHHDMMGTSSQGSHTSRHAQHHPQQPPPHMSQRPPQQQQQQQAHGGYSMGGVGVGNTGMSSVGGMPPHGGGISNAGGVSSSAHHGGGSSSGLTGSWQSDSDTPHRREMIQQIVKLLKKDKGGSPESMAKLPQMAKQLEVSLYRNAASFEAYRDMSTLKKRLQLIAAEVQRKTRNVDDRSRYGSDRGGSQSQQQQHQMGMRTSDGGSSPFMGNSSSSSSRAMMDDMNPMANRLQQQQQQQYGNSRMGGSSSQQQQMPPGGGGGGGGGSGNRVDPEWKMRIKHKQQRLLLLHHSAKCPHENGTCPTTQHCADMKRLWRHMEGCKDNGCRVPHCFSSRAILSHYRKCKDPTCPACGPVRQTVRKSKASTTSSSTSGSVGAYQQQAMNNSVNSAGSGMGATVRMSNTQSSMHSGMSQPPPPPHGMMQQQQPSDALLPTGSFQSTSSSVGGSSFQQRSAQQPQQHMPPPPGSDHLQQQQRRQSFTSSQQQPRSSATGTSPSNHYRQGSPPNSPLGHSDAGGQYPRMDSIKPSQQRGNIRQDSSEWQKIRHKQQRLLLLRHASRCQHEAGKCPVTPHCAGMKELWEHIAHCKNQQCTVQHCLSSRYVLSHYRRCKDVNCPACGPVRETIRKSQEKEEKRKQLAQQSGLPAPIDTSLGGSGGMGGFDDRSPASDSYQPELKRAKLDMSSAPDSQHPVPSLSLEPSGVESIPIVSSDTTASTTPAAVAVPSADPSSVPQGGLPRVEASGGKSIDKEAKAASDLSLLQSFTVKQLQTHLASLDRKTQLPPAKLKSKCLEVLKGLQTHQHGWVFNCPVDPVELGLPDYFDIIKKPMDLGTIQKKLENGAYHSLDDFQTDVFLTFDNAMTYNEDGSVVFDMAKELRVKFEGDRTKLMAQLEAEDLQRRQNERACTLCGCEKLLFEPPVYFCNGMNCQNQRIRRNSHFYIGGNNQYFWCSTCYNELDDKIPIELVDMTISKGDLKKKKNDEVHEESWVQCDTCQRWVHQICGLFNGRQNTQQHSEYCCPRCLCEKQTAGKAAPTARPPGAADLPRTMLSEWLEKHVMKRVERKKRQLAEEKSTAEGISLEEATRIMDSGPIYVRQVTSMDRKLEVRDLMKKRYAHKNYPEEFPFRCKCIVVFQELEGVDTILFALYLYEHGEDNPPPNQRVVYISYLDSVHFMRPRKIRTYVYHEILIAYLDYARRRGFSTVHIWACPPLKGDDYIFYAKPEDQKTPRDARLRQWYIDMLVECQKRNIVGRLTNMYDQYFANEDLDATAVPYLEGDYFPGEAENIIKMIEEGGGKKSAAGGKKKKSKTNAKNKGGTGTRSSGMDELSLIESGCFGGVRSFKDLDRDQVMVKLGETIMPMKDSFIVAFLNWSGAKDEDMVVPPEIEKARIEYAAKGEINDITGSKRDALGNPRDALSLVDKDGQPIKVIDDDGEDLDCEFLNNRQAFLNLCRGNHYQFDELRRSKHTSMMLLWHLHNRDAPKFVQQCVVCNREILSGMRFHCNTCPDYDLCQECFKNPSTNRGACSHKLQPIAVDSEAAQDRSGLTEEQRLQRQRNLMLHIQLIEHAARCTSRACQSNNCVKMKSYLDHSRTCRIKAGGGCKICKRIWTLLRIHAQKCKERNCPIPQCMAIREKMRQLQKQQQAMDDRRRLEMNRHMRFSMTGGASGAAGQAG